ncbi:MAG: EutN/CcmL family microcompartment protein [Clostridia bacterium]
MQIAKVIGSVVATRKDELLTGVKLLVIQPVDSSGKNEGVPLVAVDTVGAGFGELIFFAKSKEGAMALPNPTACADAGITGIIDYVYRP